MTKLLERAVAATRHLPTKQQDDIARMMLMLVGEDAPPVQLTQEEEEALDMSEAAAARGEFASDEEIRAIWAKHGL